MIISAAPVLKNELTALMENEGSELIDTVKLIQQPSFWYNAHMRKNRVIEQNRCYHLVSRLAHRAFFLDDAEKDRAVALMRRIEAGVQASMGYCINRTVSISSDPFSLWRAYQKSRTPA